MVEAESRDGNPSGEKTEDKFNNGEVGGGQDGRGGASTSSSSRGPIPASGPVPGAADATVGPSTGTVDGEEVQMEEDEPRGLKREAPETDEGPQSKVFVAEVEVNQEYEREWEEYFDDRTGEALDKNMVNRARMEEVEFMLKIGVFEQIDHEEYVTNAEKKAVSVRWVDVNKGSKEEPEVRSRLVARDFKPRGDKDREDLFAAMPPLEAKRLLFCQAAAQRPVWRKGRWQKKKLLFVDVKKAHLNGKVDSDQFIVIELPREVGGDKRYGRLRRWLYGMRGAASAWERDFSMRFQEVGFEKGKAAPTVFWHREKDVSCVVHGDDFTFLGLDDELDEMCVLMRDWYEIKVRGRLGEDSEDDKDIVILNRRLEVAEDGLLYRADPKHVQILVKELGLEAESKGTDAASARDEGKEDDGNVLDKMDATKFRALAARANYLAQDRFDLQYAAKEACRCMASPTVGGMKKIKRIARYVLQHPEAVWKYRREVGVDDAVIDVYSDSDWAGCTSTRRSTSGGIIMVKGGLIKSWSSTQACVAMSSGEAEYYGAVKGAAEALSVQAVAKELGWPMKVRLWVDSSAAKAVASRTGLGKVRHLEVKFLWLQEVVREGRVEICKIKGENNIADIGTKPLNVKAVRELFGEAYKIGDREEEPRVRGAGSAFAGGRFLHEVSNTCN